MINKPTQNQQVPLIQLLLHLWSNYAEIWTVHYQIPFKLLKTEHQIGGELSVPFKRPRKLVEQIEVTKGVLFQ